MLTLMKCGVALFALFESVISHNPYNKLERKENRCQPKTPEEHLGPQVPHQKLSRKFLDGFDEVIVIGDLHGCYDEMELLLNQYELNNSTVLKLFTGDLTRKGPKNLEVVRFVKDCCSCLSVRGNNDEMTLLRVHKKKHDPEFNFTSLDSWMANLTQDEVDWMREIPYSLNLPSLNARVVHGGFLPDIPIESNRPYTMMNIRSVLPAKRCPGGWQVTRRELVGECPWASQWRGPDHIYFGHDHRRQLQLYPFATGVDTACVRGHYMTGIFIKGPRAGTFATQPALKQYYYGDV